jgi:hypothetical protein
MSFLPDNSVDKFRKQREYKAALDAQVGGRERVGGRFDEASVNSRAGPSANVILPSIKASNVQPQTQFQFGSDDPRPPPPRLTSEDPRVLLAQMEKLVWNMRSSDEIVQGLQSNVLAQEHRFKQEIASTNESFTRFSQGTDHCLM